MSSNRSAPPPAEAREALRTCGCDGQFVDVQLSGGFHQRVRAAAHRGGDHKVAPADLFPSQRQAFRTAIDAKNNWYQLIMNILGLNPQVRDRLVKNLVDGNIMAWPQQEKMRHEHQCNIPWAILLDPTSACNLHCTGRWAAEYGHKLNRLRGNR